MNAIIKVSEANPALDREGEPTALEARDAFIKALLAELFPEDPSVPSVTVPTTTEEPKKEKKKRAPKKKEPEPAAEPAPEPAAEPAAEPEPAEPKRSLGKLAAMPVSDASSNAAAGASGPAEPEPTPVEVAEKVKEKKPRKPKAEKPAADANLAKIDPTWRKHLKNADKEHAKELEPELLKYLNALSKEEFDGKKAEEHVADFVASRAKPAEADDKVEAELTVVEFNGKEYYVNPETKRVYEGEGECDAHGNWTSYKGVGYVGMAAFAEMKVE